MPTKSLKSRLKELSAAYKITAIGSLIGIISIFLPWYQDVDRFHTGDVFYGITGPLYLIGASLLGLFGLSFAMSIAPIFKNEIKFPFSNSVVHLMIAGGSFYLLLMAYSIFFHPQFGLNLIDKQPMFGLFGVLVACGVTAYGGFAQRIRVPKVSPEDVDQMMQFREHRAVANASEMPKFEKDPVSEGSYEQTRDSLSGPSTSRDIPIKSALWSPNRDRLSQFHREENQKALAQQEAGRSREVARNQEPGSGQEVERTINSGIH